MTYNSTPVKSFVFPIKVQTQQYLTESIPKLLSEIKPNFRLQFRDDNNVNIYINFQILILSREFIKSLQKWLRNSKRPENFK